PSCTRVSRTLSIAGDRAGLQCPARSLDLPPHHLPELIPFSLPPSGDGYRLDEKATNQRFRPAVKFNEWFSIHGDCVYCHYSAPLPKSRCTFEQPIGSPPTTLSWLLSRKSARASGLFRRGTVAPT